MTQRNPNLPTPADEDPIVHRFLGVLPRFHPAPAFETRVLTRVWRPTSPSLRDRAQRLLTSWHLRAFVALLAAGAFVWQAVIASLALRYPDKAATVLGTALREVAPRVWSVAAGPAADLVASAQTWTIDLVAGRLLLVAAVIVLLLLCAGGLVWAVRGGNSHAAR